MTRAANNGIPRWHLNAGAWVFLLAALALAVAIAALLGWSIWTMLLLVLLLACPIAIIWTYVLSQRPIPVPLGPAPVTRGDVRFFDWVAPWYEGIWCPAFGFGKSFHDHVAAACAFAKGEHVLDVGCGSGWLTRHAADSVGPTGTAWGIDPAPDMIRVAMQSAGCAHCGAHFKLAAVEALPFEGESFDVAVVSLVLHHLPADARSAGLKEIRRVLKREGRLIVVDIDQPVSLLSRAVLWPFRALPNLRNLLSSNLETLLKKAGFAPVRRVGRWGAFVGFWQAGGGSSDDQRRADGSAMSQALG